MNVLVTGATGVLGGRIVERLAERGHEVVGLVRDADDADAVEAAGGRPAVGDVLEPDSLTGPARDVDALVHAATAIPTGRKPTEADWQRNDRVRLEGARNLLAAADDPEHVLFPSVVWVARRPDGSRFDETADRNPDRATRSAAETEQFLGDAADERGFDLAVLRFGFLYAPDAAHTREAGERLLERRFPVVGRGLLGRGDTEFSFVHALDAARAVGAAVDAGTTGVYHIIDDETATTAAFFGALADRLGAPPPRRVPGWLARLIVGKPTAGTLTSPMPTTNEKFRREVGWEPAYPTYREGLDAVVEAWLADGTLRETAAGYEWAGD